MKSGAILVSAVVLASLALPAAAGPAVEVAIPVGTYQIAETVQGQEISMDGFGYLLVPGKPKLPSKVFSVAIPPGAEVIGVEFDTGEGVVLDGAYDIEPAPLPRVIGDEDPVLYAQEKARYDENYDATYLSDEVYPATAVEFLRKSGYRKYNLADVRVTPFAYRPLSGQLVHYPNLTVEVQYQMPIDRAEPMVDNLARTERIAEDIVLNYKEAAAWYPQSEAKSRGMYDFVIITLDSLTSAVTPLVNWETSKGRTVNVVTTSWININYPGGYDTAENIRNFLRDKYPAGEWGIVDVLLVGHYDSVPMRRTAQDLGYGRPETDYYYAELSLPDEDSWDDDEDHYYGEDTDPIDFYAEVNVGRIPYDSSATVTSICNKSVAYEQNSDPGFKQNMLLLGGFFWEDTDNAELMEAKIDQTWMADWTFTRMYEQNSTVYSTFPCDYALRHSAVQSVWPAGTYAFVNWAGHGSEISAHIMGYSSEAFITSYDCPSLNDNYPAIIFADACSNQDTDYDNIGRAMMGQGGVGFVGATKVALGCPGWDSAYDGSSQSMDYLFTTAVTSGDYTMGAAHQRALRQMYTMGLWGYNRYETFEWGALLGNPDLSMGSTPALNISLPNGAPEYIDPGVPTSFDVEITDGSESYVPGSAVLRYRYNGGTFLTSSLVHDTGDIYIATLPAASCSDTPEFYVSADGDGGSTISSPRNAPTGYYEAIVGALTTIFADDFETHQGWTVEDGPYLTDGSWDRGVPVGGGDRGDPPTDFDGSGSCYLTDNVDDNSDVDDGTTWLLSPTIDLSGGDAEIHYALWYTNDFGSDPDNDYFYVCVSNNNGSYWSVVHTFGPESSSGWTEHSFMVGDYVTPNQPGQGAFRGVGPEQRIGG